jgi:cytochrome bd-type quinol oxidase subunit 2
VFVPPVHTPTKADWQPAALFPFLLTSTLDPSSGPTLRDASSSLTALIVMTILIAVSLPIVLACAFAAVNAM